jgi:hypothetical protein
MKGKNTPDTKVKYIMTNSNKLTRGWMSSALPAFLLPSKPGPSWDCEGYSCLRRYVLPSGRFIDVFDDYKLDCEIDWTGQEDPAPGKLIFLKTTGGNACGAPAIVDQQGRALCAACAGLEPRPDRPILTIEMLEAEMDRCERKYREGQPVPPRLGSIPVSLLSQLDPRFQNRARDIEDADQKQVGTLSAQTRCVLPSAPGAGKTNTHAFFRTIQLETKKEKK